MTDSASITPALGQKRQTRQTGNRADPIASIYHLRSFLPARANDGGGMGIRLLDRPDRIDYEQLALAELTAAKIAKTPTEKRRHLDKAAEYAALAEAASR